MPVQPRPSGHRRPRRPAVVLHVEALEQRSLLSAGPWPALLAPIAEAEPNGTLDVAQPLGALDATGRTEVVGTIAAKGAAVDWYSFTLNQPAHIDLASLAPSGGGQSVAILSLFNSHPDDFTDPYTPLNHRLLAQSTTDAGGNAHVQRDLGTGTYDLAVSGAGNRYFHPYLANSGLAGATGDYGLLLTATDLPATTSAQPAVLQAESAAGPVPDATTASSPLMIYLNLSGPLDPAVASDLNITLTAAGDSTNLLGSYNFSPEASELEIAPAKALAPGAYDLTVAALSNSVLPALAQDYKLHFQVTGLQGNTTIGAVADDTPAGAHNLGDLTQAGLVQAAGAIGADPAYDPSSSNLLLANPAAGVDLYHFTISGAGNNALIAEAFAGRIGSPLDPGLTLFRRDPSDGKLHFVAVTDNSANDAPATDGSTPLYNDPVLFAGLTAGDYYLAVSSTGNLPDPTQHVLPGNKGVFDPNVGHSGSNGTSTGAYVLNLFVNPDNVPPQVTAVTPAAQPTLGAPPTQLTVTFSEPVNLEQLATQLKLQGGSGTVASVFVHGADGVDYYPRLVDYTMTTNQAKFLMLDGLPNGVNELHLSGTLGLTDIAGNPLAGNDPSGDYVARFTVTGPPRGQIDTRTGATKGLWVWPNQEPNNTATQPELLGTLFPNELQKGVVLERSATSGASDTADYYQFQVLENRPYFFTLTGANLPANALQLKDLTTGHVVPIILQGKGPVRLANLDPKDVYQVSIGGWTAAKAPQVAYTLRLTLGGSVEDPTPLTAGPAPAFSIRLPSPSPLLPPPAPQPPPPPAPQPPPVTVQPTPTPVQPAPVTVQAPPTSVQPAPVTVQPAPTTAQPAPAAVQLAPATVQPTPVVSQLVPVSAPTSQTAGASPVGAPSVATPAPVTQAPATVATEPARPLRLVLQVPSTGDSPAPRVVMATFARPTEGNSPALLLRLPRPDEGGHALELPSGTLTFLSAAPLGGVRATDPITPQTTPQLLLLQGPDATPNSPRPPLLSALQSPGGDVAPAGLEHPAPSGTGEEQPGLWGPGLGHFLMSPWLTWSLSQAFWGWILSPLVPTTPTLGAAPTDAADGAGALQPGQTAAGEECLLAVDGAWAGALLATGALTALNLERERKTWPVPRPPGEGRPAR